MDFGDGSGGGHLAERVSGATWDACASADMVQLNLAEQVVRWRLVEPAITSRCL